MIIATSRIKLNKLRKTPFISGYRPVFDFGGEYMTSGMIDLLDRDSMKPGDEALVSIRFLDESIDYLGVGIGSTFQFGEGDKPFGHGEILELRSVSDKSNED
ncbi:MAG: hypothetical protein IPN69_18720 [Acidobacteria bacterium]|nr:hypothetical protein [Acidobacteriota bacterium]MBK8812747.1 hypothetical protein [Acidobacteriota bacterium]